MERSTRGMATATVAAATAVKAATTVTVKAVTVKAATATVEIMIKTEIMNVGLNRFIREKSLGVPRVNQTF